VPSHTLLIPVRREAREIRPVAAIPVTAMALLQPWAAPLLNADQARHIPAAREIAVRPVSGYPKMRKIRVESMIRPIDSGTSIEWIDQRRGGCIRGRTGRTIAHGAPLPWNGAQQDRRGRAPGSGQHDGLAARSLKAIRVKQTQCSCESRSPGREGTSAGPWAPAFAGAHAGSSCHAGSFYSDYSDYNGSAPRAPEALANPAGPDLAPRPP